MQLSSSSNFSQLAGTAPIADEYKTLLKSTRIDHELDVFDARRGTLELALSSGFTKKQAYYLVTAITELGNNVVFHSVGGYLCLWALYEKPAPIAIPVLRAFEITATDFGPGIANIELALTEGFTTRGSMGCGLSGVKRLMDDLYIQSSPLGTEVSAQLHLQPTGQRW